MSQKGPPSFHDLRAALSTHEEEDRRAFEGMQQAFDKLQSTQERLDRKQDDQIVKLNVLLEQAVASGMERGRRIENERSEKKRKERNERIQRWFRYVVIPLVAILAHLVTKYLHL